MEEQNWSSFHSSQGCKSTCRNQDKVCFILYKFPHHPPLHSHWINTSPTAGLWALSAAKNQFNQARCVGPTPVLEWLPQPQHLPWRQGKGLKWSGTKFSLPDPSPSPSANLGDGSGFFPAKFCTRLVLKYQATCSTQANQREKEYHPWCFL